MKTTFTKLAVAAVIAGSTLFSGTASAATKVETTATNQYMELKAGMTMEQAAKVLYGKSYKTQLIKKNGSTMLKKKATTSSNGEGQKIANYQFFDTKAKVPPVTTDLTFVTKKKDPVYRLTMKIINITADTKLEARESKMQLVKGAKLKEGMTEKQLDAVLTGKGLGDWMTLMTFDFTSIATKKEIKDGIAGPESIKAYVFQTTDPKKRMVVNLDYNSKKKVFEVFDFEKVSANSPLY
ncbi:hypothetical protein [Exiguobacterium sp. RIT341]|uniref:hypothetical protein n=1 Tax=Exiguobacterium sp. RIT341 TaxID=1470592 RepID=UPI000449177B|nr:hypothetical protein [Exiguobacterium sp. RIT341]EZP59706.1 hypothetical protein BW42_02094 [Exiguobacterium sp. RIT341]